MKQLVNGILGIFGLRLTRRTSPSRRQNEKNNMFQGLRRFHALGIPIHTVIDVGAAAGLWSLRTLEFWPECSFVLFEPLDERRSELERLVQEHTKFFYVPCAAGADAGSVEFRIAPDLDGSGVAASSLSSSQIRSVPVRRLDAEIQRLGVSGPFIIKLDTHGFEMPILEGCSKIMADVELFIIECYGFRIADGSLLLWEMCREMDKLGYALFDLVDVMHRPKDGAFWQCDAFFIRKSNALFNDNRYS